MPAARRQAGRGTALLRAGRARGGGGRHHPGAGLVRGGGSRREALQDAAGVEALHALGYVCLALGEYAAGARHFQRSLALAEAEFDQAGATPRPRGWETWRSRRVQWAAPMRGTPRLGGEAAGDAPRAGRVGAAARGIVTEATATCRCRRLPGGRRENASRPPAPRRDGGRAERQGRWNAQLGPIRPPRPRTERRWPGRKAPRDARLELSIRIDLRSWTSKRAAVGKPRRAASRQQVAIGGHVSAGWPRSTPSWAGCAAPRGTDGVRLLRAGIELGQGRGALGGHRSTSVPRVRVFRSPARQQDEARATSSVPESSSPRSEKRIERRSASRRSSSVSA